MPNACIIRFPTYLPEIVRSYISAEINGRQPSRGGPKSPYLRKLKLHSCRGLMWHQKNLSKRIASINQQISGWRKQNKEERELLTAERKHLQEELNNICETIRVFQSLAQDERMRHAYSRLVEEFESDDQWRAFLFAAAYARADYTRERAEVKRSKLLAMRIAKTCAQLTRDLEEFDGLADNSLLGPSIFVSPPGLVHEDSYEFMRALDRASDDVLSRHGFQLLDLEENNPSASSSPSGERGKRSSSTTPPSLEQGNEKEPQVNLLDVLWESSQYTKMRELQKPETIDIVEAIESAARRYEPEILGAAGAAIESRKSSCKTQFLRSFWHLASSRARLKKTSNLTHAIAITSSVVLDKLVDDVSYDDARKALENRAASARRNVPTPRNKSASKKP
jgi:cell division protein FtsB